MAAPDLPSDASRIDRERDWHDRRFAEAPDRSATLSRLTGAMTLDALTAVYHTARDRSAGARVLDYGCAEGEAALLLHRYGASTVHGIDISPVAVQHAAERAAAARASNVTFEVMNAEELAFPDAHYDLVFGIGILHHLNLPRALGEIARVLTNTGSAVFLEPMAHNPLINMMRHLTPHARTEDEHPLTMTDLRETQGFFGKVDMRFVNLATLAAGPLALARMPGTREVHKGLSALDRLLLRIPGIRRYAWNVVLTMEQPKRPRQTTGA
jgi:ubiquinone/menaquinone biosynthesis C-methylase UbiE